METLSPEVLAPDEREGKTSASNAEADYLCPGRHLAQRGLPDLRGRRDADHGARIHGAVNGQVELSKSSEIDTAETIQAIEAAILSHFVEKHGPITQGPIREKRLWLRSHEEGKRMEKIHSGQPDVFYIAGGAFLVLDYKSLAGDVAASPRNLQLRDYCVLIAATYGCTIGQAAVIQPFVTHTPEVVEYSPAALAEAESRTRGRVSASNVPNAKRNAGYKQCLWCRAWETCPEAAKVRQEVMIERARASMSREQQLEMYQFCRLVAARADSYVRYIDDQVGADPAAWPEFEVKKKQGRRQITDAAKTLKAVEDYLYGVDFLAVVTIGITKFEDAWCAAWVKVNGGTQKSAKTELEKRLNAAHLLSRGNESREIIFKHPPKVALPGKVPVEKVPLIVDDTPFG